MIFYIEDKNPGWLYQQYLKMTAHNYCYSDFIMFTDSDCLFDHPINLQDFIADGKPEILYTPWEKCGDAITWREPTEKFMRGMGVEFERMRRNCLIYHRDTLVAISEYQPDLENFIMNIKDGKFSEFNAMSAFAWEYEREKYNFVNTDEWQYVPAKALQVWSHASKEPGASELHHLEYIRVLESVLKAFGIKV